jgi:predicted N-acetyltransferase YhbS
MTAPGEQAPAGLRIRDAMPDEREAIRALTLAAYEQYATIMAPTAWPGQQSAILGGRAADESAERIGAELEGELVGSVFLFPPAEGAASQGGRMVWPELRLLAVAPAARGMGVGAALIQACIERARRNGAQALGLYSSASMRAALQLYERLGFTRVPEHDFQPPGGELVMAFSMPLSE